MGQTMGQSHSQFIAVPVARSSPKQWQDTMKCTCARRLVEKAVAVVTVLLANESRKMMIEPT